MEPARYRISCDIGGTFTDLALFDTHTGTLVVEKVLTTPADPSRGVIAGVRALAKARPGCLEAAGNFVHATTLIVNAVIERKGARTALLATEGFRDLIELRRHLRVSTYEMWNDPPEPLVPRRLRLPVTERTYSDGRVLVQIDPEQIRRTAAELLDGGVESVAIAFLHSYANAANEEEVARLLVGAAPQLAVSLSSAVLPEYMEYERTSTTVVNAYVKPIAHRYVERLATDLVTEGLKGQFLITLSNGGLASTRTASEMPVRILESGPVGGAISSVELASIAGLDEVLSFDMGGTTAKACLIRGGSLPLTSTLEVARSERFQPGSGYPVGIPSVDLIEVGAGGGSIAHVNSLGLVEVGPRSAGADPGPICYGFGGQEPTVTDADVLLGYLNPTYFLGGLMKLDVDAAMRGLADLASRLGRSVSNVAWTIHDVVNENMAAAVKMHVVERGGDPSRAVVVAFGGAGPVHAYHVARKIGAGRVLVPDGAGVMSAIGLLATPPAFDLGRTFRMMLDDLDADALEALFRRMESEIGALLSEVDSNGRIRFMRALDICHHGQGYRITVAIPPGYGLEPDRLLSLFADAYRARYGYFYEDVPAEVVTARVRGQIEGKQFAFRPLQKKDSADAYKGTRIAYSAVAGELVEHAIYRRDLLLPAQRVTGPAVIEESGSTTLIDAGGEAEVDKYGTLVIRVGVNR